LPPSRADALRAKRVALEEALEGRKGAHQRFTLGVMLRHIGELDRNIEDVSAEIERRLAPHEPAIARLVTIPGIGRRTAETLLAEIGSDMSRFPSARYLASWAGMCPGNHESAGKRTSGRTRKGSPWLGVERPSSQPVMSWIPRSIRLTQSGKGHVRPGRAHGS
jgi:transposase